MHRYLCFAARFDPWFLSWFTAKGDAKGVASKAVPSGVVYFWHPMSPDQEQQVCDALVNLGWLENDHALHAEGVIAIIGVLHCSTDEAKAVLGDLRSRKRIDVTITPGGALDERKPMPVAQVRWVRPPTL
jgi:hypothetical protein